MNKKEPEVTNLGLFFLPIFNLYSLKSVLKSLLHTNLRINNFLNHFAKECCAYEEDVGLLFTKFGGLAAAGMPNFSK